MKLSELLNPNRKHQPTEAEPDAMSEAASRPRFVKLSDLVRSAVETGQLTLSTPYGG